MGETLVTQLRPMTPSNQSPGAHERRSSTSNVLEVQGRSQTGIAEGQTRERMKKPKLSLTDYATPASSVSAFCRAVLHRLIPHRFFGDGKSGVWNRKNIMAHVDSFIKLRRFENLTLHEVCKGLKVCAPPRFAFNELSSN